MVGYLHKQEIKQDLISTAALPKKIGQNGMESHEFAFFFLNAFLW